MKVQDFPVQKIFFSKLTSLYFTGVTVITTIHQPSSDIFRLFDNILLMRDGRILSYASSNDTLEIFKKHGVGCPQYTNPADHLLGTAMDRHNKYEKELEEIRKYYEETEAVAIKEIVPTGSDNQQLVSTSEPSFHLLKKLPVEEEEEELNRQYKESRPTWFYKWKALAYREFRSTLRDPRG